MRTCSGPAASTRAICARCCMPPDSSWGRRSAASARPTSPSSSSARAFCSDDPEYLDARRMFSCTEYHGNSVGCWNTTPRSVPGPSTGLPSTLTEPSVGSRKPASRRSSVDLPQPEGPTRHTISPSPKRRVISRSASTSDPVCVRYVTPTFSTSITCPPPTTPDEPRPNSHPSQQGYPPVPRGTPQLTSMPPRDHRETPAVRDRK